MNKTGLYIHIPFCVKKCAYCDFVSFDKLDCQREYFNALLKEFELRKDIIENNEIDTVFIGGGTPSSVNAEYISKILNKFNFVSETEVTIEANPGTLTEEKLKIYRECGINRVSLGVQSCNDYELEKIGRIHRFSEVEKSVAMLKKNGFDNFNLDIMFGLPYQSPESLEKTLESVIGFNPAHISAYSLIVEENTPISEFDKNLFPSEETERKMYQLVKKTLEENGYKQYEISNYSKPGFKCRHNLKYWNLENYLGLGLNAHSFMNNSRFFNVSEMSKYIDMLSLNKLPIESLEEENTDELIKDYAITAFRLTDGIDAVQVKNKLGIDFYDYFKNALNKYITLNLIEKTDKGFKLSEKGIEVSNYILSDFV